MRSLDLVECLPAFGFAEGKCGVMICNLNEDRFEEFLAFNRRIYPERNDVDQRFKFQIAGNSWAKGSSTTPSLIACNDEGKIVGQFVICSNGYHYAGQFREAYHAADFYVLPEHRGGGVGFSLATQALGRKPHFAIDVSNTAKHIYLSLGAKIVGALHKFLWVRGNPLALAVNALSRWRGRSLNNANQKTRLPSEVSIDGVSFRRVTSLDRWKQQVWDPDVLEFSRSLSFLNRRFFDLSDRYCFYVLEKFDNTTYFVVRESTRRRLKLLVLVDYRLSSECKNAFLLMVKAAKSLVRQAGCDGLVTMSSHRFFDGVLRQSRFFRMGEPALILTNAPLQGSEGRARRRCLVYVTMADGDVDFNYY